MFTNTWTWVMSIQFQNPSTFYQHNYNACWTGFWTCFITYPDLVNMLNYNYAVVNDSCNFMFYWSNKHGIVQHYALSMHISHSSLEQYLTMVIITQDHRTTCDVDMISKPLNISSTQLQRMLNVNLNMFYYMSWSYKHV